MKLKSVTLSGTKSGTIWMPACNAEKQFQEVFTTSHSPFHRDWTGIRDALLYITNDGDFQSCSISELYGVARWIDERGREITQPMKFSQNAEEYSDCLTDDCLI
jgi:hypothetical protein